MVRSWHKSIWLALVLILLAGCQTAPAIPAPAEEVAAPDLSPIQSYLSKRLQALNTATVALAVQSDRYYALAEAANFDYAALWAQEPDAVVESLTAARAAWMEASPLYEQSEGIVAGTPALAEFDVILDAGGSGADDPASAVPFDLTLPDGRVLPKPGNLFGVTESTLWGTEPGFVAANVSADWNQDGAITFGEILPDANVLKAAADALNSNAAALLAAVESWQPTVAEAFTALVVMTPTMSEYFASWRDSRFVLGEASAQRDFVAISRLADIQDILSGLQIVYAQVEPLAQGVDAEQATQVGAGLRDLKAFVASIYAQEQGGRRYTPEEADLLGAEAQNQATAVTGQLSQLAAELNVALME